MSHPRLTDLFCAFLLLTLTGCACPCFKSRSTQPATDNAQIEQRLQEIFEAAESKDFDRLDSYHLYGPSFTKFAPGTSQRQDAIVARQRENTGLNAINNLAMKAEDLKIDRFGDIAIASFLLDYSFTADEARVHRKEFTTLVFKNEHGEWKIVHEHLSLPTPAHD